MSGIRLFLRSLLLQAGWNTERMQALGFTFALLPLMAGRGPEERVAFVRRHLAYVNTSPALSGVLLGMVVREEERIRAEQTGAEEAAARVAAVKRRVEGPLAALGDRTLWGWLRPLAGVIGALALVVLDPELVTGRGSETAEQRGLVAMAVLAGMLAFYNVPYLAIRVWGTRRGLDPGGEGALALAGSPGGRRLAGIQSLLEVVGPIAIGALAIRLALAAGGGWFGGAGGAAGAVGVALVASGFLITAGASRFGQPPERVAMVLLSLLILAAGGRG